ncbi:MAG: yjeA [Parcubacteria group bacterium]|nr:yjeA [Parcubacteria group bacterium]
MEPNEPTLQEEVAHDTIVLRTEYIIGGLVVLVLILAGVIWYMAVHPSSSPLGPSTATTTPATGTTATGVPGHLDEHGKYYDITAAYPATTPLAALGSAEPNAKAVDTMKQFEIQAIAAFKEQGNFANLTAQDIKAMGFDQGRKESLAITYQTKSAANTISYIYTITEDTFGAHPNTTFKTFTFDKKTGTILSLKDLFAPGADYLTSLSTLARKMLPATIAAREGIKASQVDTSMLNSGTAAKVENFQNWYVDGKNLVLIFPPYQVAAYAAGEQIVSIPSSQLTSLKANTQVNDFGVIQ